MLRTPLCHQIGIAYPIFSVGMGPVAGPELAAAVRMPAAVGCWAACSSSHRPSYEEIRRLHTLTDKPFGVNLILPLLQEGQIDACLAERVPLLVLFWGDPRPSSPRPTAVRPRSSSRWDPSRKPRQPLTLASMRSSPKASKRGGM